MKRLQRYEEFQNNQVQEGIKDYLLGGLATLGSMVSTPQQASGQTQKPTEIVASQDVKKDILGRTLISAPSTKTENLGDYKYLVTTKQVNPSPKRDAELKAKGYKPVWIETSKSTPKWGVKSQERKAPVVMKSDNDKFFELGGYTLTQVVKDTIQARIMKLGGVDSVKIEASTDKTPLTKKLKADLESKGYSGDNSGLSKARSNAIKNFLVTLGINPSNIVEINLANQGKEGGYDPSARYVKLTLIEKGIDTGSGKEYFEEKEEIVVYYQRISDTKQKMVKQRYGTPINCEDGKCATYD
jgi:outer membrane protein OmpA-like peptidoglycan-associated protein